MINLDDDDDDDDNNGNNNQCGSSEDEAAPAKSMEEVHEYEVWSGHENRLMDGNVGRYGKGL